MEQCVSGRGSSWAAAGLSLSDLLLCGAGSGHAALGALFVSALSVETVIERVAACPRLEAPPVPPVVRVGVPQAGEGL